MLLHGNTVCAASATNAGRWTRWELSQVPWRTHLLLCEISDLQQNPLQTCKNKNERVIHYEHTLEKSCLLQLSITVARISFFLWMLPGHLSHIRFK